MASQTKTQPNSGFNRRLFLAGAAGGAMLPVAARAAAGPKRKNAAFTRTRQARRKRNLEDKVADFSYQNDVLAQLIVEMWAGATCQSDHAFRGRNDPAAVPTALELAQKQLSRLGASIWSNPS